MNRPALFPSLAVCGAIRIAFLLLALTAPDQAHAQAGEQAANKAIIRRHFERLNRGDLQSALLDFADDTQNHGRAAGRQGLQRILEDIFGTFPDWRMAIVEMIAEGDSVVVRCMVSGTHQGVGKQPINGAMLVDVAPTGRHFEVQHIHWYQLKDGKIVQHRANRDDVGMMRQLGLLPPAPAAPIAK